MRIVLLILLLVIVIVCIYLRRKAVRWLFTTLAFIFGIAFLALLGFMLGYQVGNSGVHVTHILF